MSLPEQSTDADFDSAINTPAKRIVKTVLALVAIAGIASGVLYFRNRMEVATEDLIEQIWTTADAQLEGVDLGLLHSELLPSWEQAFLRADEPKVEIVAREELTKAVASSPELAALIARILNQADVASGSAAWAAEDKWVSEWNALMLQKQRPFLLHTPMNGNLRRDGLLTFSYYVQGTAIIDGGGKETRFELASRVDSWAVREGYLGHASRLDERGFLMVDAVLRDIADDYWTLLAPDTGETADIEARHAAVQRDEDEAAQQWEEMAVRSNLRSAFQNEVAQFVSPEALEILKKTATARLSVVNVVDRVNDRQSCGSPLLIQSLPLRGFDEEEMKSWRDASRANPNPRCPIFSAEDFDELHAASLELQRTVGLRDAIRELGAFAAREVALHETRHVLDNGPTPLACPDCKVRMNEQALAEFSAFLATIAWTDSLNYATLRLCDLGSANSYHGHAARAVLAEILPDGCAAPIPADLQQRARDAELRLLGRSDALTLRPDFPKSIRSSEF